MKKKLILPVCLAALLLAAAGLLWLRPQGQPPLKTGELAFSHPAGIFPEEFTLTIQAPGAEEIRYTLDGSDPRASITAQVYGQGISVNKNGRANVVSAVPMVELGGSYNRRQGSSGYVSTVRSPSDEAVDKCTVIKAAARYPDGSYSPVETATYFVGTPEEHIPGLPSSVDATGGGLAVISITMAYDDLFDSSTGIYVKGDTFVQALAEYQASHNGAIPDDARSIPGNYSQKGREWERPAHVELFEMDPDGAVRCFAQDCGVRVQGNYSRSDIQKGLRLIADKDYGENRFRFPVFGEDYTDTDGKTMDRFKSLVLRAGGNSAFLAKFNDTYWQSLASGLNCGTLKSRPCVVYLNGEYWGLYVLQEDYTKQYFSTHYGVDKEQVIMYKGDAETYAVGYKLDIGEFPEGVTAVNYYYQPLLSFFNSHSRTCSDADRAELEKMVDSVSLADYFAVHVFINNKWDWPGKNWAMWRTNEVEPGNPYADGRWRFCFYDIEFGGIMGGGEVGTNTIKEDNYKPMGLLDQSTGNPMVKCFAYLMTNGSFRQYFYSRLRLLSEETFARDAAVRALNGFVAAYAPLYDQFFRRYPGAGSRADAVSGGYGSARCIRDFLNGRHAYIETMITWTEQQFA